jgi:hypothetical protein
MGASAWHAPGLGLYIDLNDVGCVVRSARASERALFLAIRGRTEHLRIMRFRLEWRIN